MNPASSVKTSPVFYNRFLLCIAGLGGLLYGIDIGIISAALLYLGKTVDLTVRQTSAIVAAVLGGSMLSSLIAGFFAEWFGRKKMVILSGLLFVSSVSLIVLSHGFVPLLLGRLLQGFSGGVIAVVVPLYLAECLSANTRGRGSAVFQFMLTFGILAAAFIGWFYIHQAEAAIHVAANDPALVRAAEDHAWRGMFLSVIYPGVIFFVGAFFLSETPRWLFRQGRIEEANIALRRASSEAESQREMSEMEELALENTQAATHTGSLLQRKYVVPFVLACVILACNQATGINSVLSYLIVILKQAGMSANHAAQGDLAVKLLNCVMTIVAIALIDRKGRKFLLTLGTGGIILALLAIAFLFYGFESHRQDITAEVQREVRENSLKLPSSDIKTWSPQESGATALTVLYSYGTGDRMATLVSTYAETLSLVPDPRFPTQQLNIKRAFLSHVPAERTGWFITFGLALFIASFSIGPGVVVWLTLSELMPTRIRSAGMGIALLLNQGVSTLIAGVFLPLVSTYGYYLMFLVWAGCTVVYFITAAFFLPETKGKTLEEIERQFDPAHLLLPRSTSDS
ncbi:MFS transporter [Tunturiibacter empetritectus]|uniref:MFS family permease n=1 Tax=Tunturiibacter lichenicola TaxID=2051959 RepID=A0A852VBU0_9BACT|nr:MFS transporter [Edaphobacter lichenicola]NYF88917.1 MFS family permease [Edaphobacter lichenicola]